MFRPVILSPTTSHSDIEAKYFFEKRAAGENFSICAPKKYDAQGNFHVKSCIFSLRHAFWFVVDALTMDVHR